jgi:PadR family transcriptional regulator, regulatory protein PadR
MSEDTGASQAPEPGRMPKDFLTSWLLLLMRNGSAYGYQLIQTLTLMGMGMVDSATVYRMLRQLEEEEMITSFWEPGATGPARRIYALSDAGEEYLRVWARQLERYQSLLDRFFKVYEGESPAPSHRQDEK